MRRVAELLNDLRDAGVITNYALFGAAAQMRYTSAVVTLDADVLVAVPLPERLDLLGPIYDFCRAKGYPPQGDAVKVGSWPVQFIPILDSLTREALEQADTVDFEGVPFRVVRATHLAAIAVKTGRAKDTARVLGMIEAGSVTVDDLGELAERHGLTDTWQRFRRRFLDE